MKNSKNSIPLAEYIKRVAPTDTLKSNDLQAILFGLFGEVGSIMSTAKKLHREGDAYADYKKAVQEEFGDALWYFCAVCKRLKIGMDEIFSEVLGKKDYITVIAASDISGWPLSNISKAKISPELDATLLKLGAAAGDLLAIQTNKKDARELLCNFADLYLKSLQATRMTFADILHKNIKKVEGRFLEYDRSTLPTFDLDFPLDEQLPQKFEISITQQKSGRAYMKWNGVFIGDPLTDNIINKDGYRYHDVFHLANAAILHWSPTFRGLIKRKRKSDKKVDEAQDGGRAIVIEEGLTAWIFARAKDLKFFEGQNGLSFDLLKTIEQFVCGYEVEACPLKLWEDAILQGYEVFRKVNEKKGGIIIGNRKARTLVYKEIKDISK
jgi:NTP pyrophosphatase (non-canonical NTP hydrolase)